MTRTQPLHMCGLTCALRLVMVAASGFSIYNVHAGVTDAGVFVSLGALSTMTLGDTLIVRPGDARVQGARIRPYTTHWRVSYQGADGKPLSGGPRRTTSWYDTVSVTTSDGRRIIHRRQTLYASDSALLEVLDNWANGETLAPLRTELRVGKQPLATRTYEGTRIVGADPDSTAPNGVRRVSVQTAEPVFDFYGGIFDVFLAALPLRQGLVVKLPTDDPTADAGTGLTWTTLSVIGRDTIATESRGPVESWRIEAPAAGTNKAHFVFWVADNAPYLVRMWYVGPRGGKQIWDITS
jgi:hypothetical protein